MSARAPLTARGGRHTLEQVSHLALFLVVGAGFVRLALIDVPLCWYIVSLSGALALVYAAGLTWWDRLGPLGRRAWVPVLVLLWTVLTFLTQAPLTTAYVWCALPLACAALRVLGRRAAVVTVAVITVVLVGSLVRATGRFDPEVALVPVAAVWATVALYRTQQRDAAVRQRLVEELRDTRDTLAEQQRQAGVLAERTRIARDLHDTLAQELAGSVMMLQVAERDWDERPDVARTRVRVVADGLGANLAETRRIIRDLTPAAVAEAGLEDALRLLCARSRTEGAGASVRFHAVGTHQPVLDDHTATTLFRVAQSTLANVREHARAASVLVTYRRHRDRVELEVSDDGLGFDPTAAFAAGARADRGFGLPAARARLRECGGDLDVSSVPGRGTRVRATVSAPPRIRPVAPLTAATAS
ncbi:sensor histidine kinase [Streptomyces prunicolor]|uniref:sensor histidine kinase n=1 Tax=Streptomyces prunicolor TaxID=67348 RepID=UPI002250D0A3|nr:sensor histidine kinase [Streptomyces prunicolor]MCX5242894.1 sensor histidine kinase [Streptomyces prunicolor]